MTDESLKKANEIKKYIEDGKKAIELIEKSVKDGDFSFYLTIFDNDNRAINCRLSKISVESLYKGIKNDIEALQTLFENI